MENPKLEGSLVLASSSAGLTVKERLWYAHWIGKKMGVKFVVGDIVNWSPCWQSNPDHPMSNVVKKKNSVTCLQSKYVF